MNTSVLLDRAKRMQLHGLIAHLPDLAEAAWVEPLLTWEESERSRRSQERRLRSAQLGRFKPLADFDWNWPKQCDRAAIAALLRLEFMDEAGNVVLIGPNGVGKSTIARNIAHQAVIKGHTVLFTTAWRHARRPRRPGRRRRAQAPAQPLRAAATAADR